MERLKTVTSQQDRQAFFSKSHCRELLLDFPVWQLDGSWGAKPTSLTRWLAWQGCLEGWAQENFPLTPIPCIPHASAHGFSSAGDSLHSASGLSDRPGPGNQLFC